jgi:hypothetical protein
LFPIAFREWLWDPLSLLANGYRGIFPPELKQPEREADHPPPSSAEVNAWSYTSASLIRQGVVLN